MAQNRVERLKAMLRRIEWNSEESRHEFLREFDSSIASFNGIDCYKSIFSHGEIDLLLIDCLYCDYGDEASAYDARSRFIEFVIGTGYRDEVEISDEPRTVHRTTAIHHAARIEEDDLVNELFGIYDQFEVNYSDHSGLTHFHAASMSGVLYAVRDFIEHGHDVNDCWTATGDTPLHLSLDRRQNSVAAFLMINANRPNLWRPNAGGVTVMQLVIARNYEDPFVQNLFDGSDEYMWQWARVCLRFMMRFRLSLESCDIVLGELYAPDWWNICVATNSVVTDLEWRFIIGRAM
ncbi:hypothetical protein TKK_0000860 [Trichogramma kaykai]